jgi:hypothetical protein
VSQDRLVECVARDQRPAATTSLAIGRILAESAAFGLVNGEEGDEAGFEAGS